MKEMDTGYFGVIIPEGEISDYRYQVTYEDGSVVKFRDAYAFPVTVPEEDIKNFRPGFTMKFIKCLSASDAYSRY